MSKKLNIGLVGATGMVGTEFLKALQERNTPIASLRLFVSERSQGKNIEFKGQSYPVQSLSDGCFKGLDLVFFSAGADISLEWAPKAVKEGAFAIDNSSAFRMHPEIVLSVPEVNAHILPKANQAAIIANPNCSTIQMVVALLPLQKKYGIKSVRVATYQSVSGAGIAAVDELKANAKKLLNHETEASPQNFVKDIAFNNIPQIDKLLDNGFTGEEEKMIKETKKILDQKDLKVSAFCVRTPSLNGHSEAVWVELDKNCASREEFIACLKQQEGLHISENGYTTNREADGKDPVYLGRIRQDLDHPNTWLFWCVSDNIRKGAALNGLQIAETIFDL